MPSYTDTYSSTYLDTYGVASSAVFPLAPLDLRCELQLGGQWVDVSSKVYQRDGTQPPVTIQRGKPDETQTAPPGSCAWQWNNRDGRFSPKNPVGPYYGQLKRNTAVRWSVPAASNYLRLEANTGDYATAADNANLHITGSAEMRWYGRLSDWQGCVLAHRWDGGSCWAWLLNSNGTMTFFWEDSGVTQHAVVSDAPVPYTSGDFALKLTLDATTGTVTYYTAATIDGTYTQVGDAFSGTGGAATSLRAGTAPLSVGYEAVGIFNPNQALGRVYEFRLYSGIGGTLKADGIFSAQAAGTASWTDAQGNSWSLTGAAEISSRDYRYHGLMSSQPPKWDVTGNDQYVQAQAGGPLRLLGQGSQPPVRSAMYRAVTAQTGSAAPVAYWPMEDSSGATQFGSALGGPPMTWAGGPPVLATSTAFACSAPLPAFNGALFGGQVPAYTTGAGAAWAVRFLADFTTLPGSSQPLLQINVSGGLAAYIVVFINGSGNVQLVAYDASLNVIADTTMTVVTGGIQRPLWWSIEASASGSNVQYAIAELAPGSSTGATISVTSAATGIAGYVGWVLPAPFGGWFSDTIIGHMQVQPAVVSLFSLFGALAAHAGEAAGTRFARLCTENGWPVRIKGSPALSAAMGAQGIATLQQLLQECETADRGQLLEPRECAGLGYRTLASMYNQAAALTLSYPSSQPGGVSGSATDSGLDPTYDDLLVRNDWTLTRGSSSGTQGATVRSLLNDGSVMSVTGLTDYGDSATVNVATDSQLSDVGGWMVHVGTVDEHRWPTVPVNLARTEMAALQAAAMQADVGDLVEIDSIPNVILYDPVRQLALGFTEQLGGKHWTMQYQEVPASPYGVVQCDVGQHAAPPAAILSTGVNTTATSWSVSASSTDATQLWSTAGGDYPQNWMIDGEEVTVSAVSGSSSPQTATISARSVNGVVKSHLANAVITMWPAVVAGL